MILAAMFIVLLSPVLLSVALAVKYTSPGGVLFRQVRVGKDGRTFAMYKFRSMVDNAHSIRMELAHFNEQTGPIFKIVRDPRVTPLGYWLRKFSIDELPQLFNVVQGEMSLVGPRPALPEEVHTYSPRHRQRLTVVPGMTCIWQVSGRSNLSFEEWMDMDIEYIHRRSLWLDIKLLFKTIPAVLTCRGAF